MGRLHPRIGCDVQGPQSSAEGHGVPPSRQGDVDKDGPEAFFANYEVNAWNAGIPAGTVAHDAVHINNLQQMMPDDLRNRIAYMPMAPTTYATYKSTALRLYGAYKERKD